MNRWTAVLVAMVVLITTGQTYASIMSLRVDQDATLSYTNPDQRIDAGVTHQFLWVGDNTPTNPTEDNQSMFGFDVTPITSLLNPGESLVVTSMIFRAYNNGNNGDGDVHIALGNTDTWDEGDVTWNNSHGNHGSQISSVNVTSANINSYVSWDVTSIGVEPLTDNDYVTFYLYIDPAPDPTPPNWHTFEREEYAGADNAAYVDIDYTINAIPEPATLVIWSLLGTLGLIFGWRRRKTA